MLESVGFIQWCIENLNYFTVAFLMMIESSFVPFPSEVVVPPAAYKAAAGELNIFLVVLSATAGAVVGALVNYVLAFYLGRPVVYKFANSKFGNMCLITQESVEKAEEYFKEKGAVSTLVGRLVPAVRQLISVPAGLAKMKLSTFLTFTALGAGIWNCVLAAIGYYLHSVVPKDLLMDKVNEYSHSISMVILALVGAFVCFLIYKGVTGGKKSKD